jgi:hypothetical protein
MTRAARTRTAGKYDAGAADPVEAYQHSKDEATRKNNPEVGLAIHDRAERETKTYAYDAHRDSHLVWSGKCERDAEGLIVDTVSLPVRERVSTPQIIPQAKREEPKQLDLFGDPRLLDRPGDRLLPTTM